MLDKDGNTRVMHTVELKNCMYCGGEFTIYDKRQRMQRFCCLRCCKREYYACLSKVDKRRFYPSGKKTGTQ